MKNKVIIDVSRITHGWKEYDGAAVTVFVSEKGVS
jgi:hypothetical protein